MLIHGVCYSTMLHEEPFVFMRLGRAVERVGQTARILDVKHHSLGDDRREENAADAAQWLAILRSCSAVDAFFQRSANVLSGPAVAEFLLFDRSFPRAVLYNLDSARELLAQLGEERSAVAAAPLLAAPRRLRGSLLQMGGAVVQELGLHKVLTPVVDDTAALCDAIHADYLDPPAEDLLRGARRMRSVARRRPTRASDGVSRVSTH